MLCLDTFFNLIDLLSLYYGFQFYVFIKFLCVHKCVYLCVHICFLWGFFWLSFFLSVCFLMREKKEIWVDEEMGGIWKKFGKEELWSEYIEFLKIYLKNYSPVAPPKPKHGITIWFKNYTFESISKRIKNRTSEIFMFIEMRFPKTIGRSNPATGSYKKCDLYLPGNIIQSQKKKCIETWGTCYNMDETSIY